MAAVVIDLLRRNSDRHVRLELDSETNLDELQEALGANTSVEEIDLFLAPSFQETPRREFLSFVARSIGSRQNLQRVTFDSEEFASYDLHVGVLSELLNSPSSSSGSLTTIDLRLVALSGDARDFAALEESFQNHQSPSLLKELRCKCWLSEETRRIMTLDPLMKAIAASRSLESLYFHPTFLLVSPPAWGGAGMASATAGTLCTIPSLRSLDIGKCNLTDDNVAAMARAVEHNGALAELRISGKVAERGIRAIGRCLRINAKLEVLRIHTTHTPIRAGASSSSSPPGGGPYHDDYHLEIPEALKTNHTLKHFSLHGVKLSQKVQRAFATMIKENNYALEDISLVELEDDLKREIDVFTLLNQHGRGRLLQQNQEGTTSSMLAERRHDWIDAIALVSDELDGVFYLLSKKPSLCDLQQPDDIQTTRKRQSGDLDPHQMGKRKKKSC